jgi:uncharacterized coiled-coil protein SlyX
MSTNEVLEQRLIELEIRSEERRAEIATLERFVRGYEARIEGLERQIERLKEQLHETPEGLPDALDDLPPHY